MARMVKRLSNLEIDEISLVDKPANQHGLVAIAKSYQEDNMETLFDSAGTEVFEEELEHGDTVYDEAGNEYVFTEDDDQGDDQGDDEGDEVGKKLNRNTVRALGRMGRNRRATGTAAYLDARDIARGGARDAGAAFTRGRESARRGGERLSGRARSLATASGMQYRALPAEARFGIAAGGGAGLGAGGTYAATNDRRKVGKSLGEEVYAELSKALTDDDRNETISKVLGYIEDVAAQNAVLQDQVDELTENREFEGFTELAKSYEMPGDPDDIAGLMLRASQVLPAEDVASLDRLFSSYGEITKAAFSELGYGGMHESDALAEVYAVADSVISKSGDDISQEQAVTALFSANPDAYDQYESENRR